MVSAVGSRFREECRKKNRLKTSVDFKSAGFDIMKGDGIFVGKTFCKEGYMQSNKG